MTQLSAAGRQLLAKLSPCLNEEDLVVAPGVAFTVEDQHRLLEEYYSFNINEYTADDKADEERSVYLAHLYRSSVGGGLCVRSLGGRVNRLMADRIRESCARELGGSGAAAKCEALYQRFDSQAVKPSFFSVAGLKYYSLEYTILGAAAFVGGIITGAGFHLGGKGVDRLIGAFTKGKARRAATKVFWRNVKMARMIGTTSAQGVINRSIIREGVAMYAADASAAATTAKTAAAAAETATAESAALRARIADLGSDAPYSSVRSAADMARMREAATARPAQMSETVVEAMESRIPRPVAAAVESAVPAAVESAVPAAESAAGRSAANAAGRALRGGAGLRPTSVIGRGAGAALGILGSIGLIIEIHDILEQNFGAETRFCNNNPEAASCRLRRRQELIQLRDERMQRIRNGTADAVDMHCGNQIECIF